MMQREDHRTDDEQSRSDDAGPYAARRVGDARRFHRGSPDARLSIRETRDRLNVSFFPFVLEDVKRLRRFGQESDVNERRSARENGATAFDPDVEKDISGARENEVGRQAEQPEKDALRPASAPLRLEGSCDHFSRCSCDNARQTFARRS